MWRRYIHEALAECDAAVILLSNWSLGSAWVRYEATVLTERAWQDNQFKLLPVVLPGTDRAKLDTSDWRPLQLSEIQYPKTDDSATIIESVKKFVGDAKRRRAPFDRMLDDVGKLLENVPVQILERTCVDFGVDIDWKLHQSRSRSLADILARRVLRDETIGVAEAVKILDALTPHLRRMPGEEIVNAVSPLWVSQSAASALAIAATKKVKTLTDVALNGWRIRKFTADQYVQRANPFTRTAELALVGDNYSSDLVAHVRKEVRDWVKKTYPGYADESAEDIDEFINRKEANLFVLLPTIPEQTEIEDLRDAYEKVTFVCAVNGARPNELEMPDGIVFLEPALTAPDVEKNAFGEIEAARRFVGKLPQ